MAGPVTTGTILGETFRVFSRGAGTVLGISFAVHSPVLLAGLLFLVAPFPEWAPTVTQLVTGFVFGPLASAALIHAVFQLERQRDPTASESLRVALSRFWAVLGLSLLVGIAAAIATIFCVIPGLVVQAGLFVAVPALVVERSRIGQAFNRSWNLTDSYKLSTFGVIFVLALITWAFAAVLLVLLFTLVPDQMASQTALESALEEPALAPDSLAMRLYTAGNLLFTVLVATLQATAATVAYRQLRETKEGLGEDELLAVFD
jgi:hypothetical protein